MNIGNRIKQRRVDLGISAEELATMTGKSRATIYRYENGDIENLPTTVLEPLAEALETTPAYLMGWEDDTFDYDNYDLEIPEVFNGDVEAYFESEKAISHDVANEQYQFDKFLKSVTYLEKEMVKQYRSLDDPGRSHVDTVLQWEADRMKQIEQAPAAIVELQNGSNEKGRLIDYYRSVSAGSGEVIFDDVYSERITLPDIPEYRRVAYAVKVDGRSMEPLYNDGDILLVEPTCDIEINEIGIFNVDGKAYVKKLGKDKLISLNKGYGDIQLTEDSLCMGRVVDKL